MSTVVFKKSVLVMVCLMVFMGITGTTVCFSEEWYMRGSVGYEKSCDSDFRDAPSSEAPDLFGNGSGEDGKALGTYGDFGSYPVASFAIGRQLAPWLRTEIEAQYRFDMAYRGNANFLSVGSDQPVSTSARSLCGLVSLFVDIGGRAAGSAPLHPFVGAGLGMAYNHVDEMTYRFPDNSGSHKTSVVPAGNRKDVAFMVTAGTGVDLTDNITLDIAYRYQDLGKIGTDQGAMIMDILPDGIEINETEAAFRTHGISAGLRYKF